MPRPTNRAVADRIVALIRRGRGTHYVGRALKLQVFDVSRWEITTYVNGYGEWYLVYSRPGDIWFDPPPGTEQPTYGTPTAENYRHARIAELVLDILYQRQDWRMQRPWPTKRPAYGGDRSLRGPWVYQELAQLPEDA